MIEVSARAKRGALLAVLKRAINALQPAPPEAARAVLERGREAAGRLILAADPGTVIHAQLTAAESPGGWSATVFVDVTPSPTRARGRRTHP